MIRRRCWSLNHILLFISVERKAPIPPPRPSVSDADDDREDYEVVGQPMKRKYL